MVRRRVLTVILAGFFLIGSFSTAELGWGRLIPMVRGTGPNAVPSDHIWRYVSLASVPLLIALKGPVIVRKITRREIARVKTLERPWVVNCYEPRRLAFLVCLVVSFSVCDVLTEKYYASRLVFAPICAAVSCILLASVVMILREAVYWGEQEEEDGGDDYLIDSKGEPAVTPGGDGDYVRLQENV